MKKILLGVLLALGCCVSAAIPVLASEQPAVSESLSLEDGEYAIDVTMTGGSGKATVQSPTLLTVTDGVAYASITWSSTNYDYMIVDGQKYLNESGEKAPILILQFRYRILPRIFRLSQIPLPWEHLTKSNIHLLLTQPPSIPKAACRRKELNGF